jgi:hypothetical protein
VCQAACRLSQHDIQDPLLNNHLDRFEEISGEFRRILPVLPEAQRVSLLAKLEGMIQIARATVEKE